MENLKQKLPIERWKVYLSVFLMVAGMLGWLVNTIYSAVTVEQRMFDTPEQKQLVLKEVELNSGHRNDQNIHMPFQKKMECFVYKPQYDKDMEKMDKKLDEIIDYLIKKK